MANVGCWPKPTYDHFGLKSADGLERKSVPDTILTIEPALNRLTSYNQLGQSGWKRTLKRKLPLALALNEVRNG
jgi:hypothetical protein